jgi:hypothetical protein
MLTFASLLAAWQLSCGKTHTDDAEPGPAGKGGSGGSAAGAGTGGSKGGTGGKAGSSDAGAGGSAGNSGKAGAGGSSAGNAGNDAAGAAGEEGGTGGGSSGRGGQSSGGTGGSDAGGEGGAAGGFELPEVLVELVDAFCGTARNCCEDAGQPPAALDACELAVSAGNLNFQNVARGTLTVDEDALQACVAAYVAAADSCVIAGINAACRGVFRGTVADGEACSDGLECDRTDGPRICEVILSQGDDAPGTCVDPGRGALGTACGGDCRENSNCSSTFISVDETTTTLCFEEDGLYCRGGEECSALLDDGEECPDGVGCSSSSLCSTTCEPLAGLDDPCFFTPDCERGLICQASICVAAPFADAYTCVGLMPAMD